MVVVIRRRPAKYAAVAALVCLCLALGVPCARAQSNLIDKIQSSLDGVARGMDYVGRKAGELIGPGLGLDEEKEAAHVSSHSFEEHYPVGPAPMVSVSNEFGAIHVDTWEERVVRVQAEVMAGAETEETAREVAEAIDINVGHAEDLVEIHTFLPDTRGDTGLVSMAVNYRITLPRLASLACDNFFGDTTVRGVGGLLAIESHYGEVRIADLAGPVKARSHGEFPFSAQNLSQGGVFDLYGARAEFSAVHGELLVSAFRGAVTFREPGADARLDVMSDSAPIVLVLAPEAEPDLTATVLYGKFESQLPCTRTALGRKVVARSPNVDALQQITLNAAFADVRIERETREGNTPPRKLEGLKPFKDVLTRNEALPRDFRLVIDAIEGDIHIEGTDKNWVRLTANRIVWVEAAAQAANALDALEVQVQQNPDHLLIRTIAPESLPESANAVGRVDLDIRCPRWASVEIRSERGLTSLTGLSQGADVRQTAGTINATGIRGALSVSNQQGDVVVSGCGGPLEASARYGDLSITRVDGKVTAHGVQGKMILDGVGGNVLARNSGGDVRILALDGVRGTFDVAVEDADLSMVVMPASDVAFEVKTHGGVIHSAIPLTGSVTRDSYAFQGRLGEGSHAVRLEARNGDVYLD